MEINRCDVFLSKSGVYVVHIEHENILNNMRGELEKMELSSPRIKCGISYGEKQEIMNEMEVFWHYLSESPNEPILDDWIFIFGVYDPDGYLNNVYNWEAYCFNDDGIKNCSFAIVSRILCNS